MLLSKKEKPLNIFWQTTDTLTKARLSLAGGNTVWSNEQIFPNKQDCILADRENANMGLGGCNPATLSACDTGLAEIKGSEGVFGLQRALKMAGVKNLIVSLWKVPDRET